MSQFSTKSYLQSNLDIWYYCIINKRWDARRDTAVIRDTTGSSNRSKKDTVFMSFSKINMRFGLIYSRKLVYAIKVICRCSNSFILTHNQIVLHWTMKKILITSLIRILFVLGQPVALFLKFVINDHIQKTFNSRVVTKTCFLF